MLIPLLLIGLAVVYLVFNANRNSPEVDVCSMARGLLVAEFAPTGEYGAFSETQAGIQATVARILKSGEQVGDEELKGVLAEIETEAKRNHNDADVGTIGDLVSLCRSKHYIS